MKRALIILLVVALVAGAGVAGYDLECTLFARCTSACDASETDWQP